MTSASPNPRCSIRAATSSAIASKVVGRSMSTVRPCARRSTAMTLRPSASSCAAMRPQIHGDDPATFCQQGQHLSEHLEGADSAVQQDQGLAFAVYLIGKVETVHRGVFTRVLVHDSLLSKPSISWATSDRSSSN